MSAFFSQIGYKATGTIGTFGAAAACARLLFWALPPEFEGRPDEYIDESGMDITKAFLKYAQPLVGELPEFVSLKGIKAKA